MDFTAFKHSIFNLQSPFEFNEIARSLFRFQYRNNKIYHSFVDALGKTSSLKVVGDDEPADAQIQLTVAEWGFRLTQGFSSVIYPTLNVLAQMDRGDEMIWRTFEAVTPFNGQNVYGYTPLTYRTDPEALRRALTGITQISAQYLVKELK